MHYLGLRHKHERALAPGREKTTRYIVFLDKVTLIIGIIGPATVLPQVISIYSTQSAADVSFTTWFLMTIVQIPWILYGFAHKDKILISSFILWTAVNTLVIVGIVLYGSV